MFNKNTITRKLEGTQRIPIITKSRSQEPELKLPSRGQDPKGLVSRTPPNAPGYRLVKDPAIYKQESLPLPPPEPYMDCTYEMTSQDEKWLQIFINRQLLRLSNEKFKRMIKLLEVANYEEYRCYHLMNSGEVPEMVQGNDVIKILNHLKMKDAVYLLAEKESIELPICEKLYLYWRKLRLVSGMPLLRMSQPQAQATEAKQEKSFHSSTTKMTEPYEIKGISHTNVMKPRLQGMQMPTMVQMASPRRDTRLMQKPLFSGNVLQHPRPIVPVQSTHDQSLEKHSEQQSEDMQCDVALKEQHHTDIIERQPLAQEECERARLSSTLREPDARALATHRDRESIDLNKVRSAEGLEAWEPPATFQSENENLSKRRLLASGVGSSEPKQIKIASDVDPPIEGEDHVMETQDEPDIERESLPEDRPAEKPIFKREIDKKAVKDSKKAIQDVENAVMSGKLQLLQPHNTDIISVPPELTYHQAPRIGSSGIANCIDWHYQDTDDIEKIKKIKNGKHRKIWCSRDLEDFAYAMSPSSQELKEFIFERRELLSTYDMANELYQNYKVVDVEPVIVPIVGKKMVQQGRRDAEARDASSVPASTGNMASSSLSQENRISMDELIKAQMEYDQREREKQSESDMLLARRLQKEEDDKNKQQCQHQQTLSAKKEIISSGSGQEPKEAPPTARAVGEIKERQPIIALRSQEDLSCDLVNITDLRREMAREARKKHKLNRTRVSEIYKLTSSNPISKITQDSHDNLVALVSNDDQEQSKSFLINVNTDTIKDIKVVHKKVTTEKNSPLVALIDPNNVKLKEVTSEIEEIHDDFTQAKFGQHLSHIEFKSQEEKEVIQKALVEKEPLVHMLEEDVSIKWIFDDLISTVVEYIKERNEDNVETIRHVEEDKTTCVDMNDDILPEKIKEEEDICHHSKDLAQDQTLDDDIEMDIGESELKMGNKELCAGSKSMTDFQEEMKVGDHMEVTCEEKEIEEEKEMDDQIMEMFEESGDRPSCRTRQAKRKLEDIMGASTGEESSKSKRKNKKKPN